MLLYHLECSENPPDIKRKKNNRESYPSFTIIFHSYAARRRFAISPPSSVANRRTFFFVCQHYHFSILFRKKHDKTRRQSGEAGRPSKPMCEVDVNCSYILQFIFQHELLLASCCQSTGVNMFFSDSVMILS